MITNHKIDYITYSTFEFIPRWAIMTNPEVVAPKIGNYNRCVRYEFGMLVHSHTQKPKMKQHITLSGKALENMRDNGIVDVDIVKWLKSMEKPKFGRIDIAVTAYAEDNETIEFTPELAWQLYQGGKCETKLKADKPVVDIDKNVETFYVGSRKSRNRLLRVYDKGIELGKEANKIIRAELETREYAAKIADEIELGHNIAGIIRRYVDFNHKSWDDIMQCEPLPRYRDNSERENTDISAKMDWLLTSVAPAMANVAHEIDGNFDNEFWDTFTRQVAYHYNKLNS